MTIVVEADATARPTGIAGLAWLACSIRTGEVLADLTDLICREVSTVLGGYRTTSAVLPLATAPIDWERATLPGGSCLVLVHDGEPVWGGIVWRRQDTGWTAVLSLATWESFGDRRFVGDLSREDVGQSSIAADLASLLVGQTPLTIEVLGGAGAPMTRHYEDAQDKTVLEAMSELSAVIGGPEWCVTWRHLSNPERYVPVLTIADRIGTTPAAGLSPAVTFDYGTRGGGNVTQFTFTEDYSTGKGATSVVATSSPTMDVRPQSAPQVVDDPDRPLIEHRFTPTTSITQVDTLTSHAQRAGAAMAGGQNTLELTANVEELGHVPAAPKFGSEWFLGDVVGYDIVRPYGRRLTGRARAVAMSMTLLGARTITPTLLLEDA